MQSVPQLSELTDPRDRRAANGMAMRKPEEGIAVQVSQRPGSPPGSNTGRDSAAQRHQCAPSEERSDRVGRATDP